MGLKGVVELFIAHLVEMLILYSFCAFIFCLEITALGYRWRIVLIVVDNAWWLGKLKLITRMCHWVWRLKEYINFMYWLMMCIIIVYMHCVVLEERGDVLHGLGEERWWTSKPDVVWEKRGDGLRRYSSYAYLLKCWYSSYAYRWKCDIFLILISGSVDISHMLICWCIDIASMLIYCEMRKCLIWVTVSYRLFGQVLDYGYELKIKKEWKMKL